MQSLLIAARALHFASVILLSGILAFAWLIAEPALRRAGLDEPDPDIAGLRRRFVRAVWTGLLLALVSGAAWLVGTASEMSGKPLADVFSQGIAATVLIHTRFGQDWLLRLILAALLGSCLYAKNSSGGRGGVVLRSAALAIALILLASLAWSGHGAATPGPAGNLHLAADILHLIAAGFWLGTLPGLVLLLAQAGRARDARWTATAGFAARRFSGVAVASVVVLLASGLVNTWFLAGSVPALVGTGYGRLLLAKLALFLVMLIFAAVNLFRLTPRLAESEPAVAATAGLRRNALFEATLGVGILAIVGVLGLLPPGLHTEPGWPFPFRIDFAALPNGSKILLAVAAVLLCGCAVGAVIAAAAGRYRRTAGFCGGAAIAVAAGWIASAPGLEPAYPTSFYAPARPYDAASVTAGAALYADNCALCHGADGKGDGPAAAGLPVRPANLTEPHLFSHNPGDLFWWVSHGAGHGAMPGFAAVMTPDQRWDVINFIRARAAGILARELGPAVASATYPVPDFAFEAGGKQQTLSGMLQQGPVLLVLFDRVVPVSRLRQLAADQPRLSAAGLRVVAVALAGAEVAGREDAGASPLLATVSPQVASTLALFRSTADGLETELLLDRGGNIRARWTAAPPQTVPDAGTLLADAKIITHSTASSKSHFGHAQ
jgi:copper resistance protein D